MSGQHAMLSAQQVASAANQRAYQNTRSQLDGLANAYRPTPKPEPQPMRTPDQIRAQMEARLAELEREVAEKERKDALPKCAECKFGSKHEPICKHPLVAGLNGRVYTWDQPAKLCGPEKALWEERPLLWARFCNWFLAPWMEQ